LRRWYETHLGPIGLFGYLVWIVLVTVTLVVRGLRAGRTLAEASQPA